MSEYEVWATNDAFVWKHCLLRTDDRDEAKNKAQNLVDAGKFRFVAIDRHGLTIWSNDPETPAIAE